MGLYTSVYGGDGTEYQIKTGDDCCQSFRIGDAVPWRIDTKRPGVVYFGDGVYEGCAYPRPDAFVVVKDHRIAAIVRADEECTGQADRLHDAFCIQEPAREWWHEAQWRKKEKREARERERRNAQFQRDMSSCHCGKKAHDVSCILKAAYPQDAIKKLVYAEGPLFRLIPKQ